MKISTLNNKNDLFLISGMFAGRWIWKDSAPSMQAGHIKMLDDPLCSVGDNIEKISQQIVDELRKVKHKTTLVSNSLGSLIALKVAAIAKDNVAAVIISGSAGFGEVKLPLEVRRKEPALLAGRIAEMVCHDKSTVLPEDSLKAAMCFSDRQNFKNILRLTRQSNSINADDVLSQIECPVVAIWGDNDVITPLNNARPVLDRHGVKTHVIPKCGHSPMYEKPSEFANLVNLYLN